MRIKNLLLIALSAILLNVSLIFPDVLFFLVFLFLVPVFYIAFTNPKSISFSQGFIWGVIFFSIHFFGFVLLFYKEANSAYNFFKAFIPLILALYCALYSGLWFFLAKKMSQLGAYSLFAIAASWGLWTYLYFNWVRYGMFLIFGEFVGYPFCHPALPLAYISSFLSGLPFVSKSLFLVLIILFALSFSLYITCFKKTYILFACIWIFPFFLGVLIKKPVYKVSYKINTIGYISPMSAGQLQHPLDIAQAFYYKMVDLLERNPQIQIVFMPESSYPFCLYENQDVIALWSQNALGDEVDLFLGAPYKEGGKRYNALYWISKGKIQQIYKKTRLMAFAEYPPKFWEKIPYFRHLFLDNDIFFSHGTDQQLVFEPNKDVKIKPLICSDFFMGRRKELQCLKWQDCSYVIIAVNDAIFPMQYLRDLMFLYAKLEAIAKRQDILYVGYYFAAWISKDGYSKVIAN